MSELSAKEFLAIQERETVDQEIAGVTVRMAHITCRCGWKRTIMRMYKCLYCGEWMCEHCAEAHFGKTRTEYKAEKIREKVEEALRNAADNGYDFTHYSSKSVAEYIKEFDADLENELLSVLETCIDMIRSA